MLLLVQAVVAVELMVMVILVAAEAVQETIRLEPLPFLDLLLLLFLLVLVEDLVQELILVPL
jgi:hypothetical protein